MAYNYGSVLQSYALKQAVERLGYDVRFINLKPECFEGAFNWSYPGSERLRKSFDTFRKQNFPHSLDLYDKDGNILEFNNEDIFVVGSDQIWNVKYSDIYFEEFLLNFVPEKNKKIAYAASIGEKRIDLNENEQKYLQRFDYISCREKSGAEYLNQHYTTNAVRVLDPTLLGVDYKPLFNSIKTEKNKNEIVFACLGSHRERQYEWVKYISDEIKLRVRVINCIPLENSFLYSHYVEIDEWLNILNNSDVIVTNSYHVICFAIIFEKKFIVIPHFIETQSEENKFPKFTSLSRFESLLSDLGLEDRIFTSFEEIKSDHRWKTPIDYKTVYKKLQALREYSLEFLKNALNN